MKLLHPQIVALLRVLAWVETQVEGGVRGVLDGTTPRDVNLDEDNPYFHMFVNQEGATTATHEEMIRAFRSYFDEDEDTTHNETIMDKVVEALTSPWARNSLAGPVLQRLRDEVLTPTEKGLAEMNIGKEKYCASCGGELKEDEMVTFMGDHLRCYRCFKGGRYRCGERDCDGMVWRREEVLRCERHQPLPVMPTDAMFEGTPVILENMGRTVTGRTTPRRTRRP